jgi:arabinose-5-phosphate isomerase
LAAKALHVMTKTPDQYLSSLIVVNDVGDLSGMIRLQDCLRAGVE